MRIYGNLMLICDASSFSGQQQPNPSCGSFGPKTSFSFNLKCLNNFTKEFEAEFKESSASG